MMLLNLRDTIFFWKKKSCARHEKWAVKVFMMTRYFLESPWISHMFSHSHCLLLISFDCSLLLSKCFIVRFTFNGFPPKFISKILSVLWSLNHSWNLFNQSNIFAWISKLLLKTRCIFNCHTIHKLIQWSITAEWIILKDSQFMPLQESSLWLVGWQITSEAEISSIFNNWLITDYIYSNQFLTTNI